ncbi:hypothetical protein KEM54_005163, partial [Ascosphaera aggregata]
MPFRAVKYYALLAVTVRAPLVLLELADCADPAAPLVPELIIDEYRQREPAVRKEGGGFPLPPEITPTIIEGLPSKELISFFNASFQTLSFAPLYLRHHLNRFLPHTTLMNNASTLFTIFRAIGDIYTDKDYKELDEKWKHLDRLQVLAASLSGSLKVRSIRWLLGPNDEPEFGEMMLIKNTLLRKTNFGPQAYYTTYPDHDTDFNYGHGQFAVEVIPFNRGLVG